MAGTKRGRGKDEMRLCLFVGCGGRGSSTACEVLLRICLLIYSHQIGSRREAHAAGRWGEVRKGSNVSLEEKGESTNSRGIDQQGPSAPGAASNDGDIHAALEYWFGVLYATKNVERKTKSKPPDG